jgi:hypothetical protein
LFSWITWTLLQGITFFAQVISGAGPGAWVTGVGSLLALIMTVVALFRGEKNIVPLDYWSLAAVFIGLLIWIFTKNPLGAVITASLVDAIGYIPTFRKTYTKPDEETLSFWVAVVIAYFLGIAALDSYALVNWIHSASIGTVSLVFVFWIIIRRAQMKMKYA